MVVLTVAEIGTVLEALDCLERSRVPILMTDARGRELRRMTLIRETLRDAVKSIR